MNTVLKCYLKVLLLVMVALVIVGNVWMEISSIPARGLAVFIEAQDFSAYYTAGQMVLHDVRKDFYNPQTQFSWQRQYTTHLADLFLLRPFFYPPFFALLFLPLALLELTEAYILWFFCNGLLLFALYKLFLQRVISRDGYLKCLIILLIISYLPFVVTLFSGQASFLMLASLVMVRLCLLKGHKLRAGLWLSLFLVKPQYVLLPLLFFVLRKENGVLKGFAIGTGIILLISYLIVGGEGLTQYRNFFVEVTQWKSAAAMTPYYMNTLRGFLQLWSSTNDFQSVLVYWLIGVMAIVMLLVLSWRRKTAYKNPIFDLQYSSMIIGMIIVSPWTSGQDLVFLLIPAVLMVFWSVQVKKKSLFYVCLLLLLVGYISAFIADVIVDKFHIHIHIFYMLGLLWLSFYLQRKYSKVTLAD